ncbi:MULTISPECIES: endonuclease domain-containing protein [unclassified Microbacterium]|uniref:endonuclease domain-containing protein n=1 Tax=unclassified Microbacterium TaxID=2609290 RepID=UPI001BE9D987|nr:MULTISPECIES: endonuclease domain-containing protein [unclassified Microbacterium]MBT2484757.1 hypothetical protein [Microbacterium sp. ISL-108]
MRYGISDERLVELLADVTCDICGSDEPGGLDFAIDHDHACCPVSPACGQCVRGVLCTSCNMGLGAFGDDIDTLRAAITYLENAS